MTEVVCLLCNAQSPENALYCQQCGQPLRCKDCRAELLPNARACIQCGKRIPERAITEQFSIGIGIVPPGYNRLKLHETPDVRDLDLIVSNEAIEHIGDFLPPLVGNRPKGIHNSPTLHHQAQQQTELMEVTSEIPAPQPQLPAVASQVAAPQEGIWEIFRNHDGRLTQERLDLKATSKRDYIIRLAHLYMYARWHNGEEKIPRDDVFKILDEAGVKDSNRSKYVHELGIRSDENETLRLTLDGRDRAQQYITEIFDPQAAEGWRPNSESHATSVRAKKVSKKGGDQHKSTDIGLVEWISHELTKETVRTTPHSIIDPMSVQNKALFALFCLDKVGVKVEVQISQISQYLYKAFQIQVAADSMPKALIKAVENKPAYATYRKGVGYRITSSGIEYVERILINKQAQFATADSGG